MSEMAPEYGTEDEVFVAVPDDQDPVEDEVDDSAYDMSVMEDHRQTDADMEGEDDDTAN